MAKDPAKTPRQLLEESIAKALSGTSLWNLCRGNTDFFVDAFNSGLSERMASALRKIGKYTDANLAALIALYKTPKTPTKKSK